MKLMRTLGLTFSLGAPVLWAAVTIPQPMFFKVSETADFRRGRFDNTSLREGGALGLAPGCRLVDDVSVSVVWTVADFGDLVVVGSGHRGSLLLYPNRATNGLPVNLPAAEVLSVVEGPKGDLFVGTAPKGVIFKVKRDGSAYEIFAMLGEGFVWDLLRDGKDLVAATGNPGRIYRISFDKHEPVLLHTSTEDNILKVRLFKGALHFSTSGKGLLARLEGEKAKVLYDAGGRDINDFESAGDSLVLATSGKKMIPEGTAASGSEQRSYFQNEVIEIDARGRQRQVFSIRNQILPSLRIREGNQILVGTADEGEIYQIDLKSGRSSLLHKIPGTSITAFSRGPSNTYLVTGVDTGLYQLELAYPKKGSWTSDVFDTRGVSQWGRVNLSGQYLVGVVVFARTGNTYTPGKEWGPWLALDPAGKITNENARFVQIRLDLAPQGVNTPEVSEIRLFYGIEPRLPAFTAFQVGRNNDLEKNYKMNLDTGDLLLWWEISDDRPDQVEYRLALRNLRSPEFKDLDLKLRQRAHVLRRAQLPDGEWQLRVSAVDRTDSAVSPEPRDSMVSRRIVVDNTPPVVTDVKRVGDKLSFKVSDQTSLVFRVEASARLEDFKALAPVDGLCDSAEENFVYEIPPKAPFVIFKVLDDQGNDAFVTVSLDGN